MSNRQPKSFDAITASQRARDASVLRSIKEDYVNPLIDELEEVIAGYKNMSEPEKFIAIMRENEKYAPKGYPLPLDFGATCGLVICSGLVFSGDLSELGKNSYELLYECRTEGDDEERENAVVVYSEKFPQLREGLFIGENVIATYSSFPQLLSGLFATAQDEPLRMLPPSRLDQCLLQYRSDYEGFPPTFKIGILAQLVAQSVLVPFSEACRFVAGWTEEVETRRWLARQRQSVRGPHGWILKIRDIKPENELMRNCAVAMRSMPQISQNALVARFFGNEPAYKSERNKQHNERSRRERTNVLVEFIDSVLPSRGLHVGRTGAGKHITYEEACIEFNREFPQYSYKESAFRSAYFNAKKARQGDDGNAKK